MLAACFFLKVIELDSLLSLLASSSTDILKLN